MKKQNFKPRWAKFAAQGLLAIIAIFSLVTFMDVAINELLLFGELPSWLVGEGVALATIPAAVLLKIKKEDDDNQYESLSAYLKEIGMTEEEYEELSESEQEEVMAGMNKAIRRALNKAIENKASKSDIDKLQKTLEQSNKEITEMYNKLVKITHTQGQELVKMREEGMNMVNNRAPIAEIKQNMEAIKNIAMRRNKQEIQLKALSNLASIANSELGIVLPDLGQLAKKSTGIYNIFPKVQVSRGTHGGRISYYDWDQATSVRAAAAVAEGAAFPESTAKFAHYELKLKKVGDTLPVTEEFFEDAEMFYNELGFFLMTNVDLKRDNDLVNGSGVDENINGILATIPTYTPVAAGIANASIYDLIVKMKESIQKPYGGKYRVDFAAMNLSTINQYKLEKDSQGRYLLPPFVSADGNTIDGVTIVEDNNIADNVLIVGDRKFARIYEMGGVQISDGQVGDQFKEDEFTIKVRKRLNLLIRTVDKTGFAKCTDITAALAILDNTPS